MAKMRKRDLSFAVWLSSHGQSNRSRVRVEAEAAGVSVIWARCSGNPSVAALIIRDALTVRRFRLELPVHELRRVTDYAEAAEKRYNVSGGPL